MTKPLEKVYVLRTCSEDMSSKNNFIWPKSGPVKCPDWNPKVECGNGLHGFLNGEGDSSLANWNNNAKWLVVEVLKKDIVDLTGKVKFPKGKVVFVGDRKTATDFLQTKPNCANSAMIGCYKIGGDKSTLTGGYNSTLTGGYNSTLTGGEYSTLTWKIHDGIFYRLYTFYVGENKVLPNTKYKFDIITKELVKV